MTYTGHKNKHMINGANIVDWVMCQIIQESKLYGGIPMPSREQVALVIRAMRMHHLLEYASNYDFPKPQKPDDIIKFFPAISSIGRFFRDAPLEVLDEYKWNKEKAPMTSQLNKEAFIKLAEAYAKQENYEKELSNNLEAVTEKYKVRMGFIGLSNSSDLIMDVVLDLLGEDFSYYFYDCKENFNKFNKNTTLADGTHPNVKDFGELWEFNQKTWR